MKNPKIGFCRGDSDLFGDIKILVNKCWLKLSICCLKSKDSSKNGTFYGATKSLGGFCNMDFKHVIWCLKQVQRMYLTLYQTILWYLKNWKKIDFLKFWQNPFLTNFYSTFKLKERLTFFSLLSSSGCNFWSRGHMITCNTGIESWDVGLLKT